MKLKGRNRKSVILFFLFIVFTIFWQYISHMYISQIESVHIADQLSQYNEVNANYYNAIFKLIFQSSNSISTTISQNPSSIISDETDALLKKEENTSLFADIYILDSKNNIYYENKRRKAPDFFISKDLIMNKLVWQRQFGGENECQLYLICPIKGSDSVIYYLIFIPSDEKLRTLMTNSDNDDISSFIVDEFNQPIFFTYSNKYFDIINSLGNIINDESEISQKDVNKIGKFTFLYSPLTFNNWRIITYTTTSFINRTADKYNVIYFLGNIILMVILGAITLNSKKLREMSEKNLYNAMEQIKLSEESFKIAVSHQANIVYMIDVLGNKFKILSDRNFSTVDFLENDAKNWFELINPDDLERERRLHNLVRSGSRMGPQVVRIKSLNNNDNYLWYKETLTGIKNGMGTVVRIIGTVIDVNDEQLGLINLQNKAEHDALTGVYNRAACEYKINSILGKFSPDSEGALILMDIDNFKSINDTYGHQCGDLALKHMASTLKNIFRETDYIGRLGGDEFIVWMKDVKDDKTIKIKVSQLNKKLNVKYADIDNLKGFIVSAGVSYAQVGDIFNELYKRADIAMYQAKHQDYGNKCVINRLINKKDL